MNPYIHDPLTTFHSQLRSAAPAGYPMMSFQAPHPFEMAAYHQMRQPSYPFRYGAGRSLRMQIYAPRSPRSPVRSSPYGMRQPRRPANARYSDLNNRLPV